MDCMAFLPGKHRIKFSVCALMSADLEKEMGRFPSPKQYDPGDDRETE